MAEKQTLNIDIVVNDGKAKQSLDKVTKSTGDLNKESQQSLDNFGAFGLTLGGVKTAFAKIIPTSKLLFKSLKMGLISTGIGAFVVIIGSLVSYFKNTKKGAELLQQGLAGMGAVVSVITDRFSALGELMVNAFSNPKQAIEDLWTALQKNIVNRFKGLIKQFSALGTVMQGVFDLDMDKIKQGTEDYASAVVQVATGFDEIQQKNIADTFKGITKEIDEETKAAIRLEKEFQRIKDAERDFGVERAKTNQQIAKARLLAEDENLTIQERIKHLETANKLELKTTADAIKLAEEKLKAKQEEVGLGQSMAEDLDEVAQAEIELINLQTQSFSTRKRLATGIETLRVEQRTKEKADETARLKAIADEQKALDDAAKDEEKRLNKQVADQKAAETERQAIRQKRLQDATTLAQAEQQLEMATFDAVKTGLDVVKGALKEGSKAQRNFALFQIGVDTAKAISTLVSGSEIAAAQFAAATGPAAPFTYAATKISLYATGLASIMGNINQAKELLSSEPAFASGGMVGGYGSGTSDSVSARLSKGESVINARSTSMFQPLLSAMNVAGGGVGFARGGVAGGSSIATNSSAFMSPVKTFVVTDEMTNSQNQLASIRRKATF